MHDEIQNAIVIFYPAARKGSRSRSTSTDHSRSSTASSVRPHVPGRIGGHGDSPEIPPGDSFTPESPPEEDKDFLLPAIHTGGPATRPVTHPVPHNPSSPGWVEVPRDTSVMPGSYVDLQCKSSLLHLKTVWFLNGLQEITTSSLAPRVRISNHGHSLTLGPLETGEEVVIGCRVVTEKYGVLPSPLATISVLCKCVCVCVCSSDSFPNHSLPSPTMSCITSLSCPPPPPPSLSPFSLSFRPPHQPSPSLTQLNHTTRDTTLGSCLSLQEMVDHLNWTWATLDLGHPPPSCG